MGNSEGNTVGNTVGDTVGNTVGKFAGKVVMITGAGSAGGFGAMAAARFAAEGARLMLSDIDAAGLRVVADALRAEGAEVLDEVLSVSDDGAMAAHVAAGVARFGGLDIALNNAGIGGGMTRFHEIALEDYDRIMDVNAKGVFVGMRHQIPAMLASGGGSILNTASAAGVLGAAQLGAYAASKHAVVGMTRAAADELARSNIRVNAICPAFTITPMVEGMGEEMSARHGMSREEAYGRIAARIPMRRVGKAEEIVQAMLWIVSDENSFMTGQAISIDGGLTAV